jgi:putative two-component system response regulator
MLMSTALTKLGADKAQGTVDRAGPAGRERAPVYTPQRSSTIMIIDDEPLNTQVLRRYLELEGYESFVVVNEAREALATMYADPPDIVLLDLMMPGVSGLDILAAIRSDASLSQLPVLIVTAATDSDLKSEALNLGVTDFLSKPVDPVDLMPRVRNALQVKHYQDELEERVRQRTADLEYSRLEVIHCLARAAEYRDNETGRHVIRVGCYSGIIARELGMSDEQVHIIEQAATLHDLGKIAIPDSILLKPGKLTPEETELMQKHGGFGKKICSRMSGDEFQHFTAHTTLGASIIKNCQSPILDMASTISLTHHEKWDGSGYPLGLAGEDIPLEGRITAVADVFDALSSKRPYKPAFPLTKCFSIMEDSRGTHFDPTVLDAFFRRKDDIVAVQIEYADLD